MEIKKFLEFAHFKLNYNSPVVQIAHICERVETFFSTTSPKDIQNILYEISDEMNVDMPKAPEFFLCIGSVSGKDPNSRSIRLIDIDDRFKSNNSIYTTDSGLKCDQSSFVSIVREYLEKFHLQNPNLILLDRVEFVVQFQIRFESSQVVRVHDIVVNSCDRIKDMCDFDNELILRLNYPKDTEIGADSNKNIGRKLYTVRFRFG